MSGQNIQTARNGNLGILTLSRPSTLNAVDLAMLRAMLETLSDWVRDPTVTCVALRAEGDRAFCAGGDVKAVWSRRGDAAFMDEVYRVEYELDHLIHVYPKPFVSMVHGITMGGGCGLALHAAHRVAAEDLVLAMPETAIGLFPDVGASRFLAACPDGIGLYLGLTGGRLDAWQAQKLKLIDHIVPCASFDAVCKELASGSPVSESLARFETSVADERANLPDEAEIKALFGSASSAQAVVDRLSKSSSEFASKTLKSLQTMSPFSLAVTFEAIRRGSRNLRDVLRDDFRIAQRLMLQDDYFEGVRAMLIDRDRQPKWRPATLADIDPANVGAMFDPLPKDLWS